MAAENIGRLEKLRGEYESLYSASEYLSAVERLARIYELLPAATAAETKEWTCFVHQSRPPTEILSLVLHEAESNARYIDNLLGFPGKLDSDEVLLILSIRERLGALFHLLIDAYRVEPDWSFDGIDQRIRQRFGGLRTAGITGRLYHKIYYSRR